MPGSKLCSGPLFGIALQIISSYFLRVPGIIKPKRNRKFHWFYVTNIYNPNISYTVLISQVHLFPYPLNWIGVDPFIIPWAAHVIKMIINSVTTLAFWIGKFWKLT